MMLLMELDLPICREEPCGIHICPSGNIHNSIYPQNYFTASPSFFHPGSGELNPERKAICLSLFPIK